MALHRVRPPRRRSEVTGEHPAVRDAGPQRELAGPSDHEPDRRHQVVDVVAGAQGSPRQQHQLPALDVDVRLVQRDPVPGDRVLHVADQLVDGRGQPAGSLFGEQPVGAVEAQEGRSDHPVLRLALVLGEVDAELGRQQRGQQVRRYGGRWRRRGSRRRRHRMAQQQPAGGDRGPEELRGECRRGRVGDHDLPGPGSSVGPADGAGRGADDHELPVHDRVPGEDEVDGARVDAAGGAQDHRAHRRAQVADPSEHPVHAAGRAGRAEGVVRTVEQQQHGVATPLEQVRALVLGNRHEGREHGVQDVAELLGPGAPLPRESLGQAGEARDVEHHQAGVQLPVREAVAGGRPPGKQPGHVGRVLRPEREVRRGHRPSPPAAASTPPTRRRWRRPCPR